MSDPGGKVRLAVIDRIKNRMRFAALEAALQEGQRAMNGARSALAAGAVDEAWHHYGDAVACRDFMGATLRELSPHPTDTQGNG